MSLTIYTTLILIAGLITLTLMVMIGLKSTTMKTAYATTFNLISSFFSSAFFFIALGCGFIGTAYRLLSRVGSCDNHVMEMSCLELSQLNLGFGLGGIIFGIAFLTYGTALHATREGQLSGVKQAYDQIKIFFGSPFFFILLGSFFIYCGLVLLDATHTGFVFILAVLGIALILFGTGSQAIASADMTQQAAGKFSVGIAGGAAALAAIFGYGIVHLEDGIQKFFSRTVDYGFLELSTIGTATQTFDLEQQIVNASTVEGRPLHILKQTNRMEIMLPRYGRQGVSSVIVSIKGPRFPDPPPPTTYTVDWENVRPLISSANERIYIARQSMAISLAPQATRRIDEAGQALPSIVIPAPQ